MTDNHSPETRRVLLLDDDVGLLRMASLCLRLEGFDAIVLDLQMPVMDGRSFYREMRAQGHKQPVLILSAYGAEKARAELGAEAAIEKPFEPESLAQAVSAMFGAPVQQRSRG